MTCKTVMIPNPFAVRETATLGEAIDWLFVHNVKNLPVITADGLYRGLFGIHTLIRHLLPAAATLTDGASLPGLAFMHDSLDSVRERLKEHLMKPVLEFTDRELAPVGPDISIMETLLRLYQLHHLLPVVDPGSGRLLGIVTYWGLLARLTDRTA